jgi:tetratricopeptide (TPR) repeat protein
MMSQKKVYFVWVTWSFFLGCQTKTDQTRFPENELTVQTVAEDDQVEVPTSMWSPMKRQLTSSYLYFIGEYAYLKKDYKEALNYIDKAHRLDANDFLAIKAVEIKVQTGDMQAATEECTKLVLLYPKNSRIHTLYGKLLLAGGEFGKAGTEFEKAISLSKEDPEPYLGLIQLHRINKNLEKATQVAENLSKVSPAHPEVWSLLAKLELAQSHKAKARVYAQKAYELRANDPENIMVLAVTLDLNGQSKKAVQLYEQLFRLNVTSEQMIERMVALYQELGDLNDALSLLKEAEAGLADVGPGLKMQQAFVLWELKRYQEASDILQKIAEKYPDSDRAVYLAGLGKERIEKTDEALLYYNKIPAGSSFRIHADYRIIKILVSQKKYQQALDLTKKVINSKVDRSVEFYSVAAEIYDELKQYKEAAQLLKRGSEENPSNASVLFLYGVYLEKAGDVEQCIKVMHQVIKMDKTFSSAFNYLGYLLAERGENLDEAETLIMEALKLKPGDGFYLDSLGWVFFQKKKYDKALKTLQEALKKAPDEGVIMEHIGDVFFANSDRQKAMEYYKAAVAGRLDDRDRQRIKSKIKKIESGNDKRK